MSVNDELSDLTRTVFTLLRQRRQTVAFAESCTAGLVSATLAEIPGASEVLDGGVVTYSNAMKRDFLGVPTEILERDGAVSPRCAIAMAEGLCRRTHSDFALSITGLAGPGGAEPGKPIGLVYIALHDARSSVVRRFLFEGERNSIRRASVFSALELLRCHLLEEPLCGKDASN